MIRSIESNNTPGAVGPATKWGTAKGSMQVLDSTAESMAKRLGMPWRPDLMTGKSPEAAAYQDAIGQEYFREALAKTGNFYDAARYYHGGPDRSKWGPKTRAYADEFIARMTG